MADLTPQPIQPAQIQPQPIQPAPVATLEPTPVQSTPIQEPTPIFIQPEPIPAPIATPTSAPSPQIAPIVGQAQATSFIDQVMKFKLYIIIFASVIGLATVGYVTYSFFLSGTTTTTTESTPPPTVSSPFSDTTTQTDNTTPPSLSGNNEFGKTVQDIKDATTPTDKVYNNAVLEETTPTTAETPKKIPR